MDAVIIYILNRARRWSTDDLGQGHVVNESGYRNGHTEHVSQK